MRLKKMGVGLVLAKPSSSKSGARKISAKKNRSVYKKSRSVNFYICGAGRKAIVKFFDIPIGKNIFFINLFDFQFPIGAYELSKGIAPLWSLRPVGASSFGKKVGELRGSFT
jgi:hypothetical protein